MLASLLAAEQSSAIKEIDDHLATLVRGLNSNIYTDEDRQKCLESIDRWLDRRLKLSKSTKEVNLARDNN